MRRKNSIIAKFTKAETLKVLAFFVFIPLDEQKALPASISMPIVRLPLMPK
jgi:hypothetical protein